MFIGESFIEAPLKFFYTKGWFEKTSTSLKLEYGDGLIESSPF